MEAGPIAGPSRPRRPPGDLADRIVALQRKNAAAGVTATSRPASAPRRPQSPNSTTLPNELARSPRTSSSKLFDPITDSHPQLYPSNNTSLNSQPHLPARPQPPRSPRGLQSRPVPPSNDITRGPRVGSPGPIRREPNRNDLEFSRGPLPDPAQRILFDPNRPHAPPPLRSDQNALQLGPPARIESDDRRMRTPDLPRRLDSPHDVDDRRRRHVESHLPRRAEPPHRTLFDPNHHDPTHFQAPSRHAESSSQAGSSSSRALSRLTGQPRTREEELDRERERRRRKEGSERGLTTKKKDSSDSKSKGSRSSEGSESFKDRERGKGKGDTGVKAILKDLYDKIKTLESELTEVHKRMALDPEAGISILLDRPVDTFSREIRSSEKDTSAWLDLIEKHKQLGDLHHEFLVRVFDPLVPSSLHQLTVRYNIPSRLWQAGFHLILERLRHAWMSSQPAALDLLTDLVYHAYKFYTDLLEDQSLANFRTAWIEALGDLARYRMAIASRQASESKPQPRQEVLGRIDDDSEEAEPSGASIGAEVAQSWDVEDKETWRTTARDWYTMGITEKPGEGRLHHHLALLSRDVRGQEVRALHHFTKSLTVTHEFESSRESILPLFDSALQTQRSLPDATALDLFIRLHGMLFTRIQLDDFPGVMSRFMERLEEDARLDGVHAKSTITQVEWMLMASVNISAVLQYGSTSGLVRKALAQEGLERRKQHASIVEGEEGVVEGSGDSDEAKDQMNGDPGPRLLTHEPPPPTFTFALQLAFEMLHHTLKHPYRLQGIHHVLNPYITLMFTFISTLFRQSAAGAIILPSVPWHDIVEVLNSVPDGELKEETRLVNGPPLPEDWTIRGMEWVGRRVYERGFWKAKGSGRGSGAMAQPRIGDRFQSEMDVLLADFDSAIDISEGVVEEIDGSDLTDGPVAVNQRRWRRVTWAGGVLVKHVDGLSISEGKIFITGALAEKLSDLEAARLAEEEARRVVTVRQRQLLEEEINETSLGGHESEDGDPDLALLRERHRHLQSLVAGPQDKSRKNKYTRSSALKVIPGYTMLVFDTNVLLSTLNFFSKLLESSKWSIIVPLPVITELDGLSKETTALGVSAKVAVSYLESKIKSHSINLKIQTTKGNYLSDLLIRTEHHGSTTRGDEKNMDDRILNIAEFQGEHFVDRRKILGQGSNDDLGGGTKVVLVTSDRNLRLKARSRGVEAADEKELEGLLTG